MDWGVQFVAKHKQEYEKYVCGYFIVISAWIENLLVHLIASWLAESQDGLQHVFKGGEGFVAQFF